MMARAVRKPPYARFPGPAGRGAGGRGGADLAVIRSWPTHGTACKGPSRSSTNLAQPDHSYRDERQVAAAGIIPMTKEATWRPRLVL